MVTRFTLIENGLTLVQTTQLFEFDDDFVGLAFGTTDGGIHLVIFCGLGLGLLDMIDEFVIPRFKIIVPQSYKVFKTGIAFARF